MDHVGTLYRWSAAHVATSARARISPATLDLGQPDERVTPGWLADGVAPMLGTFRSADPDERVWGWGADRHARFWPRRMLFETVIHRADTAFALGVEPDIEPAVAADGIDELLCQPAARGVLRARHRRAPRGGRAHRAAGHRRRLVLVHPPAAGRLRLGLVRPATPT